jgi:hypothetical protein
MNTDKYMKIILTMIAFGLWVVILKPFFASSPAQAQTNMKKPQYAFLAGLREDGNTFGMVKIGVGEEIKASSSTYRALEFHSNELERGIKIASDRGWRIHSLSTSRSGTYVLLEK